MSINRRAINTAQLNSRSILFGTGLELNLITLVQEVELYETSDNLNLISLAQAVVADTSSLNLIELIQFVRDNTQKTFIERNGWYPVLVVGGRRIPDNQLHGQLKVMRTENDSAQLTFTLIPPLGSQNIEIYEGARVTLDVYKLNGTAHRIYTGTVNIPLVDLINKKLSFTCNDNRREQLNAQFSPFLPYLGYYTEEAFGKSEDIADEVDKRLQTTPTCVDFNAHGYVTITPMLPKSTADYTFNSADVFRDDGRDPTIELAPRSRIVNTININATYQFQRFYHKEIGYSWAAPYRNDVCDFLNFAYSVPQRLMIQQAAQAAGWPIRGDITYSEIFKSGFYRCGGGTRAWSTSSNTYKNVPKTSINPVPEAPPIPVLDAEGYQVYEAVLTGTYDLTNVLCFGADWSATKRWSQNITERYVLTVTAPQSVTVYGVISQDDNVGVQSEVDSSSWDNYTEYKDPPQGNITQTGPGGYWIDVDNNLPGWYGTVQLVIAKAQTTIIKAHRDNRARFYSPVAPYLDLVHTVQLNDTRFTCKGKVRELVHTLNVSTGEAYTQCELAFSRSTGSASTDALTIPARPGYIIQDHLDAKNINLDSHYGFDPEIYDRENKWTGHIGNRYVVEQSGNTTNTYKTAYIESFVVDAPEVAENVRLNAEVQGAGSYNLAIQNDPYTITF